MKTITAKFNSSCDRCGAELLRGETITYEKRTGVFCVGCAPIDPEEIRAFRQRKACQRADRYEGWADKRQEKAESLYKRDEHYRGDIAFNTQPGHIPERARVIRRTEKAFEHASTAKRFRDKAESLRVVRVAGDAEKARQARRDATLQWLHVGMRVNTGHYGIAKVTKINSKTVTIESCETRSDSYKITVDLSFIIKHKQHKRGVDNGKAMDTRSHARQDDS